MILTRDRKGRVISSTGVSPVHGWSRTPTYKAWQGIWQRCINSNSKDYKNYGGRGIMIHPEWAKFENFLKDMGKQPLNKTIDRMNNDEGYEMINCRWATRKEQANNRRNRYGK